LPRRADVVVLGAGITGLSAARALARSGAETVVIEANTIGWGASSRNGGMTLTGLKLDVPELAKRYGIDTARALYFASLAAIDLVEQILTEEQIDCSFSRCGHIETASKQSHFDGYERRAEFSERALGQPLRVVPRDRLADEIGSDIYYGGLVDPLSGGLNPARYVAGLANAVLKSGSTIWENAGVTAIRKILDRGACRFEVTTTRGKIEARHVVIATGAYTSSPTPVLQRRMIPIGSFIIATEPLVENLAHELCPTNRMIFDSLHFLHYFRLTPDRRMLFGGRAAFFPETRNSVRRSGEILHRDLVHVFPRLRQAKVDYVWGGTLDFCFDTMPHAGEMDGMHYAFGYAGHGVAIATYLGAQVAEQICRPGHTHAFANVPLPAAPLKLYTGRPWFLPFVGAYYKILDWIS
jgi:glycine/D-amino acid oxidase-like deaminating enzyme